MRCNRRPDSSAFSHDTLRGKNTAFTLVELIVCLVVVVILTALLMPALRHVREASQRLRCASNMHQIGAALTSYAALNRDRLPPSVHAASTPRESQELMVASRGPADSSLTPAPVWDSLGWLVQGGYLGHCECLYCPSHHGEHLYERYVDAYSSPGDVRIYTNYHYAGHVNAQGRQLDLTDGHDLLLLTDGLRTQSDFNHRSVCNRLFADISTDWWFDAGNMLRDSLPTTALAPADQLAYYDDAWGELATPSK
jgi:type II secretory pathway pseudopilin PulG